MNEENEYSKSDRIKFALQWLGYDEVTLGKRFNTEKFAEGEKEVIETEITYSSTDGLIPEPIASELVKLMEKVIDFHNEAEPLKQKIEESTKKNGF